MKGEAGRAEPSTDPDQPAAVTAVEGRLLSDALPARSRRILDLGCGRGRFLDLLLSRAEGYVGLDREAAGTRAAQRRGGARPGVSIVQADADDLPFRSGSFDAAVVLRTYHRLADPDRVIRELHRLLVPGGTLVLSVYPRPSAFTVVRDVTKAVSRSQAHPWTLAPRDRVEDSSGTHPGYLETVALTRERLTRLGFAGVIEWGSGWEELALGRWLPLSVWRSGGRSLRWFPGAPIRTFIARRGGHLPATP